MTEDELTRLITVARERPLRDARTIRRGPNKGQLLANVASHRAEALEHTGLERALIYKTLVTTGLRLNELRTLTVGDLSFGDVPFLKLKHSNEKNRKGSTIAIRSDLASELKQWTADKEPSDSVFYVPVRLLDILNRDLEMAEIPKADADGRVVHIHALRHSFGTRLSVAGVAPRTAQAAMRHSNISLTMNTYTDARLLDTAEAVESLPPIRLIDNASSSDAPMDAPDPGNPGVLEGSGDQMAKPDTSRHNSENPYKTLGFVGFSEASAVNVEHESATITM